ncbi:SelR-domain-containing protein [Hypoxylon crocopeplum]|nr:SelR-domain-containing protein [Hypoxylon crocopeplum]
MRFPPFSNLLRTLYAFSNFTRVRPIAHQSLRHRPTALKSMPTIPFISSLFGSSSGSNPSDKMSYPDERSPDQWRAVLTKEQFRVLREKGTEAPYSGKYDKFFAESGVYTCAGCNAPLYKANHKFKSGCGWPAYFDSIPGAVTRHEDSAFGMTRTEICCANCGGHLGHVFKGEGYPTPTDERHCVNSISLNFSPEDKPVQEESKESKA